MVSVCEIMKAVGFVVLFLAVPTMSQANVPELNSTLHSTNFGVPVAYVGETVIFTCVVRESNSMAWTSDEYIGTGGQQLEFLAAEPVGSTLTAFGISTTIATLNSTGSEFIVSQLQITVTSNSQTPSVQCRNINAALTASITFLLADVASASCDRQSACPGETVTCTCATGDSNTLVWTANGNTLMFMSTDPLLTRRNVTGSSTSAVLTENSDRNGIRVFMTNLTFISSMTNILECENVDRSISRSVIIPISETCPDPSVQVTTSARIDIVDPCTSSIVAAVVTPVIIIIIFVVIVIIMAMIILRQRRTKDATKKSMERELEGEKAKVQGLQTEKNNLQTQLSSEKKKVKQLQTEKNNLQTKFNSEKIKAQNEYEELKKSLNEATSKVATLEQQIKEADNKSSGLFRRNKKGALNQPSPTKDGDEGDLHKTITAQHKKDEDPELPGEPAQENGKGKGQDKGKDNGKAIKKQGGKGKGKETEEGQTPGQTTSEQAQGNVQEQKSEHTKREQTEVVVLGGASGSDQPVAAPKRPTRSEKQRKGINSSGENTDPETRNIQM